MGDFSRAETAALLQAYLNMLAHRSTPSPVSVVEAMAKQNDVLREPSA